MKIESNIVQRLTGMFWVTKTSAEFQIDVSEIKVGTSQEIANT